MVLISTTNKVDDSTSTLSKKHYKQKNSKLPKHISGRHNKPDFPNA
jgi:hypothetical protein